MDIEYPALWSNLPSALVNENERRHHGDSAGTGGTRSSGVLVSSTQSGTNSYRLNPQGFVR